MGKSSAYAEKFKDPRWQKMRLQIFKRDKWCCQICGNKENTLHVHHRYYEFGKDPWEYPPESLVTLCVTCHEEESCAMKYQMDALAKELKSKFFSSDIFSIAIGIYHMSEFLAPNEVAEILEALSDERILKNLIADFDSKFSNRPSAQKRLNKNG